MKETEKLLLNILGRGLFDKQFALPEVVDFEKLYNESKAHTVELLVFDSLTEQEVKALPAPLKAEWQKAAFQRIIFGESLRKEQKQVIKLLQDNDIAVALLKGSSCALNYKKPSSRIMGDIDILVSKENQKKALKLLQSKGYSEVLQEDHPCHFTVHKGRITVEIHNQPNGLYLIEDKEVRNKLSLFLSEAVQNVNIENGLPILNDKYQAVVLLLHKMEHIIDGGLGLRQVCDWATFVDKRMTKELWKELTPILKSFGMYRFAGVITRACCEYLCLPKVKWSYNFDKDLADDLTERIVTAGNFGRKEDNYGEQFFYAPNSKSKVSNFFKTLTEACHRHWPVCKKYKILMAVAPVVIYFKYLKMKKRGEKSPIKVTALKTAVEKQSLFKRLSPFIPEE